MILGMHFFLRSRTSAGVSGFFVIYDGAATHILRTYMLTLDKTEAEAALDYVVWDAKRMLAADGDSDPVLSHVYRLKILQRGISHVSI